MLSMLSVLYFCFDILVFLCVAFCGIGIFKLLLYAEGHFAVMSGWICRTCIFNA